MNFGLRLEEERKRLALTQVQMATAGGVSMGTYNNYIRCTYAPTLPALAAWYQVGVDLFYIVTGQRSANQLTTDEQDLLCRYHQAPSAVKAAVLAALTAGAADTPVKQTVKGPVGQQAAGHLTNHGCVTFQVNATATQKKRQH